MDRIIFSVVSIIAVSTLLTASAGLRAAETESAERDALKMETVNKLADVNGVALACGHKAVAARVKALVIAKVPKMALYGDAFEKQTQAGFLSVTSSTAADACPEAETLDKTVDQLERDIPAIFPADVPVQGTEKKKP